MEQVTVEYRGQILTLQVPTGTTAEQIQTYLDTQSAAASVPRTGAVSPGLLENIQRAAQTMAQTMLPGRGIGQPEQQATLASAANAAMMGVPEMAVRGLGGGSNIDAQRQQYPAASTAGDVMGLAAGPAQLGYRAATGIVNTAARGMSGPAGREAAERAAIDLVERNKNTYQRALQQQTELAERATLTPSPEVTRQLREANKRVKEIGRSVQEVERAAKTQVGMSILNKFVSPVAGTAGTVMGAQVGGAGLGAARSPGQPGAGAVQGAELVGQTIAGAPGLSAIPGYSTAMSTVGQGVPAVLGYGDLALQYLDIQRRAREEAARRAGLIQ